MFRDFLTIKSFEDIRFFYFKYKDSPEFSVIGVLLMFVVATTIFWKVILPQAHDWFSLQTEIKTTQERITQLQTNQNILSGQNKNKLKEDYEIVTTALPFHKDYGGMIQAIDRATFASEMRREDYSIEVGNLSTRSAQLSPQTTISVKVTLTGDVPQLQKFLDSLSQLLPLSEVVAVTYDNNTTTLEVNFFYKFLPSNLLIPYTDPIRVMSTQNEAVVKKMKTWEDNQVKTSVPDFVPNTEATQSGTESP